MSVSSCSKSEYRDIVTSVSWQRTSAVTGHERKTLISVAAILSAPVHGVVMRLTGLGNIHSCHLARLTNAELWIIASSLN